MTRIAIEEDNPFLAKSLTDNLSTLDHVRLKYHSSNGQELLDMLAADSMVDVVLTDIEMPLLDGISATAQVKSFILKSRLLYLPSLMTIRIYLMPFSPVRTIIF